MKKKLSFLLLLLSCDFLIAQINIVKNWDFQNGNTIPICNYCFRCPLGSPGPCQSKLIDDHIYDWKNARTEDNCPYCNQVPMLHEQLCPTADWIEKNNCPKFLEREGFPKLSPSNRFIGINRRGYKVKWGRNFKLYEGVRSELNQKIQGWTDYVFRIKIASYDDTGNAKKVNVTLSKFGDRWYRNKNNRKLSVAVFEIPSNAPHKWYGFDKKFSTDIHNEMQQLIITREKADEAGYAFIDKVELYEYCPNLMPIQNRLFDSTDLYDVNFNPLPMEAKMVHSGDSVTSQLSQGEVVCDPLSKVNFKGEWEVRLKPGTRVKRGANFRAYIAPCGVVCPIPTASIINDTSLCGQANPFYIGGAAQPNTTYVWTSDQPGALAFIDDPSVSNPLFTSPVEIGSRGTVKYTLTATNNCGSSQVREIIISYDTSPVDTPYFEISNIISYDSIQFQLDSIHPQTEKIKVQILSCAGTDTLEEYEFLRGIDFSCCSFNFKYTDWLYPCDCYKVRVATKNYCFNTWIDTVFDHTRNDSFDFSPLTNAGVCKQDHICFKTKGTVFIDFDFFNRWGEKLKDFQSQVRDNEICFRVPDVPVGTYFIVGTATDCYGNTQDFSISFAVFCSDDLILPPQEQVEEVEPNKKIVVGRSESIAENLKKRKELKKVSYILFPNPTKNSFSITYNTIEPSKAEFILYDVFGKQVQQKEAFIENETITNKMYFDISGFSSGVYLLRFSIGGESFVERIVISN